MVTYERGNAAYQRHEALREDFAKHMREAKICVFDSSLERKLIRKYAQALLAGCVVVCIVLSSLLRSADNVNRPVIFRLNKKTSCRNS